MCKLVHINKGCHRTVYNRTSAWQQSDRGSHLLDYYDEEGSIRRVYATGDGSMGV